MTNQNAIDTSNDLEEILDQNEAIAIKRKTVTGAFSFLTRTAFLQLIGFLSAFILGALFSPEDFAVYGIVTQLIGLLVFFSDIGLSASLIQSKDEPSDLDYQTAFTIQQLLSWLIVLISFVFIYFGFISRKVGLVGNYVLISLALSFPLASLKTIPSIKLERKLKFSTLVIPQIIEQIVFHGVLILLAYKNMGAMAYTYAILLRSILGTLMMLYLAPFKIALRLNRESMKKLLGFGVKFQLNDFLARIKDQLFFLVLGYFLPLREFGYIQWAKNWSMYPYNLTVQNIMAVTFPTFSRLQKDKRLLTKAIEKTIFFISLVIMPILAIMSLYIKPITVVLPKYQKWQPAVFTFIILTLANAWPAITNPMINAFNAIGQINKTLKLMVFWTILTWILSFVFIRLFGFNGMAIAAFLVASSSIIVFFEIKHFLSELKIFTNLLPSLIAVTIMTVISLNLLKFAATSIVNLIIAILFSFLIYILFLLIFFINKITTEVQSLKS